MASCAGISGHEEPLTIADGLENGEHGYLAYIDRRSVAFERSQRYERFQRIAAPHTRLSTTSDPSRVARSDCRHRAPFRIVARAPARRLFRGAASTLPHCQFIEDRLLFPGAGR